MTAVIIAAQPELGRIHVATDAALYTRDQTVVAFGTKVHTVPHWPGLVTTAGNAAATPLFGWSLAQNFLTWDDMVVGAEAILPGLARSYGLPTGADVLLAGVSAERGPEAFCFRLDESLPLNSSRQEVEASPFYDEPFKLVKLPDLVMSPAPYDQVIPANYEGLEPVCDSETLVWSLRKILTMQRHMALPSGIGGIGGFGALTTITREGIEQRVIERWSQDRIGTPVRPGSIDWDRWHNNNPKPRKQHKPALHVVGR
jgi:hypothetical protein